MLHQSAGPFQEDIGWVRECLKSVVCNLPRWTVRTRVFYAHLGESTLDTSHIEKEWQLGKWGGTLSEACCKIKQMAPGSSDARGDSEEVWQAEYTRAQARDGG